VNINDAVEGDPLMNNDFVFGGNRMLRMLKKKWKEKGKRKCTRGDHNENDD